MQRILNYIKKYWVKVSLAAVSVAFFSLIGYEWVSNSGLAIDIDFIIRLVAWGMFTTMVVIFTKSSWKVLADGAITSPKGLVLGIWTTFLGLSVMQLTELIPEAVMDRLNQDFGIYSHDHPQHMMVHLEHGLHSHYINLIAMFLIIMGSLLLLISTQKLSKSRVIKILIWTGAVTVAGLLAYSYILVPFLGF